MGSVALNRQSTIGNGSRTVWLTTTNEVRNLALKNKSHSLRELRYHFAFILAPWFFWLCQRVNCKQSTTGKYKTGRLRRIAPRQPRFSTGVARASCQSDGRLV